MDPVITPQTPPALVGLPGGNDHPVVQLPFTAFVDGRQFRGHGLSLVAAYVAGLVDPAVIGTTRLVRLVFQFDGFAVTLVIDAKMRETAHGAGEAELVFTKPSGDHLPQLRHILNAYIAGDLVALGRTIAVAGTAAPKAPGLVTGNQRRRGVTGGLGLAVLTLALIGLAGSLAYQRAYVTQLADPGIVASTGEVLRATATGQVVFVDENARQGAVVLAIQSASGDIQSLVMPCDCTPQTQGLREGSTVLIGEPVVQLVADSDTWVVAVMLDPDMRFALAAADRIALTFADGRRADATLDRMPMQGAGAQVVHLIPDIALQADQIGMPVQLRLLGGASGPAVWARTIRDRFVSLFQKV